MTDKPDIILKLNLIQSLNTDGRLYIRTNENMNLESINKDIQALEKALKIIEKTENYLHFGKSHLILEICEQINILKDKADKQKTFINSLN